MLNFGKGTIAIVKTWADFKSVTTAKNLPIQYEETREKYTIFAVDDVIVYLCEIYMDPVPAGVDFDQNVANRVDFEDNYAADANKPLVARSKDQRIIIRNTTANQAKNFRLRAISFKTAAPGSLHDKSPDGVAYTDCIYKMHAADGAETTDPAAAVKTIIDFEPAYDYEIIGGFVDLPAAVEGGTTDQWFIAVIGVPDIPANLGGSVPFVNEVNLEAVNGRRVVSDGRATSVMKYDANLHTGKLRFVLKHPVGASQRFQVYMEIFV